METNNQNQCNVCEDYRGNPPPHVCEGAPIQQEGKKCEACHKLSIVSENPMFKCQEHASPEEAQEKTDNNGHLIGEDGKLIFDPKCRNCDSPKPSSDWKEKEREAWGKTVCFPHDGKGFHRSSNDEFYGRQIADYWLSRIEKLMEAARKDNNAVFNFQSGYEKGCEQERARLIALAEDMKLEAKTTAQFMKPCKYNAALSDFIEKAQLPTD